MMASAVIPVAVPARAGRALLGRSRRSAAAGRVGRGYGGVCWAKLSAGSRPNESSLPTPNIFRQQQNLEAGMGWRGEQMPFPQDLLDYGLHRIDLDRLESAALGGAPQREQPSSSLVDLDTLERSYNGPPSESLASTSGSDGARAEEQEGKPDVPPMWWPSAIPYPSSRVRGLVLLNVLAFLFGSNMVAIKHTQETLDPITFSACRFALAAVAFAPFLPQAAKNRTVLRSGMELGTWLSVGYITQGVGLLSTDASRASFLATFTVIAVPLMAGVTGRKISMRTWGAAAMAVLGVSLLESGGAGLEMSGGDVLSLVSALFFGLHIFRTECLTEEFPEEATIPLIAVQLTTVAVLSTAAMLLSPGIDCIGALVGEVDGLAASCNLGGVAGLASAAWADISAAPLLPLVYCGLVTTATCLWIECVALRAVSSTEAAVIYTAEPIWGAMFAWVLLGERWGALGWVGAALILGGSLMAQIGGEEEGHSHSP